MKIREYIRKRRAVKALSQSIYGISLNSIGALYDCRRVKGESNRHFRKRLLRAAMKSDRMFVFGGGQTDVKIEEHTNIDEASRMTEMRFTYDKPEE